MIRKYGNFCRECYIEKDEIIIKTKEEKIFILYLSENE